MLFNLLDNAHKYSPPASVTRIDVFRNAGAVQIAVSDEAVGIPEESLQKVFDKFYRVSGSDGRAPGTGLGLSICAAIVAAMRGTIIATSPAKNGKGSAFTITLPVDDSGNTSAGKDVALSGTRILIVDDEPQILRFLKPSLTAAGYEVVSAESGKAALTAAATRAPDVILLDLGLPDMDGKEVIRELRTWSKIPILVLSARDRESEKIEALDLGADDYVNKPFGIGELTARLRTALRHAAQQSSEQTRIRSGALEVDILSHTVSLAGQAVKLTPKEFDLLAILVRNAGRVLTHRQILTAVWGPAHTEDLQYLRVFIGQLRQKLEAAPDTPQIILTEPGIGYRLHVDDG